MRSVLVLAGSLAAAVIAHPAEAQELRINLSATVSARCAVIDVRSAEGSENSVRVNASCNAPAFQITLAGDLAALPIESASVENATVLVRGNTLLVRPHRPGVFVFDVRYASLDDVRAATADIRSL